MLRHVKLEFDTLADVLDYITILGERILACNMINTDHGWIVITDIVDC